jgi:hypothetical protein
LACCSARVRITEDTANSRIRSAHAEFDLMRRYRHLSIGSNSGFFITGSILAWLFSSRFMP